jgi:hypothetical protein
MERHYSAAAHKVGGKTHGVFVGVGRFTILPSVRSGEQLACLLSSLAIRIASAKADQPVIAFYTTQPMTADVNE